MTPSSVHDIRNLALFGHAGSGKTTLVESLLAAAGEIGAAGSVERGDTVSVMNAPFVREQAGDAGGGTPWWQMPQLRDGLRLLLGAIVVLALLFGVVRPAIRQINDPAPRRKPEPQTAEVRLVEDELLATATKILAKAK